ncbi:MAG: hypothetical protein WDM76_19550 [Limisphaerales bacterium]
MARRNSPHRGEFTKTAFELTPEYPVSSAIPGSTSLYVLALDKILPSEIPSFETIHERVARIINTSKPSGSRNAKGTNFVQKIASQMTGGRTFASLCIASGLKPEVLPPFSLSTDTLPELGERATLNQLKQAAFATPIGKTSAFQPTSDGGFIVFVQSQLPVDQATMTKNLPDFVASYRRARQNEAFNSWLPRSQQVIARHAVYRQQVAAGTGN